MNDYILIEYSNSVDLGDIVYHESFENRVYLDADVSKPEYELIEEGIENENGEFSATFQKWSKKYSIRFYAQEFLVDALTLMAMHDRITITLKNGESSNVTEIEVDYEWDAKIECWAEVTITFATEFIKMTNCDGNMGGCLTAVTTADDIYDAGGAGQARWDAPEDHTSDVSFFYVSTFGCEYYADTSGDSIGFYQSINGAWVRIEMDAGQFGDVTGLTDPKKMMKITDNKYFRVPYLCSVTDEGGGVAEFTVKADGIESNFLQVYADDGGGYVAVGDSVVASEFINGYEITVGADTYDFKVKWYTHSCDYGYSNEVNETIT